MWTTKRLGSLITAGLLLVSCTETKQDENLAEYRAKMTTNGAQWHNGTKWYNGSSWYNGSNWFNGPNWFNGGNWYNGPTWYNGGNWFNGPNWFNGANWVNGSPQGAVRIENVTIEGSLLKGTVNGRQVSGRDFIGSILEVRVQNPVQITYVFRVEDVVLDTATPPFQDVWQYKMSVMTDKEPTWQPVCVDDISQADYFIPLTGMYWNLETGARVDQADSVTLACRAGAIGKCVRIGYRPWASATACKDSGKGNDKRCPAIPLKDHHQACTRMIRADYCGDGKAWTVEGTVLDIFDYLDPPIQLREEKWTFESRWQPTGAMCVSKPRHPELGFTGKCKDSKGKERTLNKCNPYEDDKGLVVSTFNGTGATGVKNNDK